MNLERRLRALRARLGWSGALAGLGLGFAIVAALDPFRSRARLLALLFAVAALGAARFREGRISERQWMVACFSVLLVLGLYAGPQFRRADFPQYFAYLRSLAFDRDLDFANEWSHWGYREEALTPTGHRRIQGSIGPALFWAPGYALAHGYVLLDGAFGSARYAADGFSPPYERSTLVGTLAAALLASFLLAGMIAERLGAKVAGLAVAGAVVTSPVLYYLFVLPGMAHGLTYALAAVGVWAVDRAARSPSIRAWAAVGLVTGLLALVRPQAAAFALVMVPLALRELLRGSDRRRFVLAAGAAATGAAFLGFFPQMLAWKVIYGHWFTQNQELAQWAEQAGVNQRVLFKMSSWFDPRALHLRDTLFAADRGLFAWHPAMLLGIFGLPFAVRRFGLLPVGGLIVFAVTAWFNGSVATYRAGDSFGARRFDVVVPFAALSFAVALEALRRRPLLGPSLMLAAVGLWNVGFIVLFQRNEFKGAAPIERVAALQAGQVEDLAESVLGTAFGPPGRTFAYNLFVGEYMYFNLAEEGWFDLSRPHIGYLAGGWSDALNQAGPARYRTAFAPRACLRFPLMVAVDLTVEVRAKAPGRIEGQRMALSLNGRRHEAVDLPGQFSRLSFDLPRAEAVAGENVLCLEFERGAPKANETGLIAAHVETLLVTPKTPSWPSPIWGLAHAPAATSPPASPPE
ncbi:MAG TPA: hypothetical protein VIZ31_02245 [Vicinamibacteria bacterium]